MSEQEKEKTAVAERQNDRQNDRQNNPSKNRQHKHKHRGHGGHGQNERPQNAVQGDKNDKNDKNEKRENRENRPKNERGEKNEKHEKRKENEQKKGGQQNKPNQNQNQNQNGGNRQGNKNDKRKENENRSKNERKENNKQGKSGKNADKTDNRKDTYVYALDGNLYVNLTNKCSNGCDFCVRNERSSYFGHYLWIRHGDPTAEKVIAAINSFGDPSKYKELVFCGFGEPTYKMSEMCAVAEYAHSVGFKTRLNTNGQGHLINKRDIIPELKGKIDFVNVSLNAPDAASYQKICRSMFGEEGFNAMVDFAKNCKRQGVDCRFSVVDYIGEEAVESCKRLAQSVGVPLYVRKYIQDS